MLTAASKKKAYQDAEDFFRGLLRLDDANSDARFALATTLFLRGRIDQAEFEFFHLLKTQYPEKIIVFRKALIR